MEGESTGVALVGGVLLAALAYFIYTKVKASRDKKGSGGGTKPGFKNK
jgi:hypothetical protein